MEERRIGIGSKLAQYIMSAEDGLSLDNALQLVDAQVTHFQELLAGGIKRVELMRRVYQVVDTLLSQEDPASYSCKKGCAFCCKMNVDVSEMEVEYILHWIKKKPISIDIEYLRKQAAVQKEMLAFIPAVSRCVFLQPDKTCGVYEARPFACRKHIVVSPPDKCDIERYPEGTTSGLLLVDVEILQSSLFSLQGSSGEGLHIVLVNQLNAQL